MLRVYVLMRKSERIHGFYKDIHTHTHKGSDL